MKRGKFILNGTGWMGMGCVFLMILLFQVVLTSELKAQATPATPAVPGGQGKSATPAVPATPPTKDGKEDVGNSLGVTQEVANKAVDTAKKVGIDNKEEAEAAAKSMGVKAEDVKQGAKAVGATREDADDIAKKLQRAKDEKEGKEDAGKDDVAGGVPEISASSMGFALVLLVGGLLCLTDPRSRRSA